jgi:hypothetical protein
MKKFIPLFILLFSITTASFAQQGGRNSGLNATTKIVKFYPNPAVTFINFELNSTTVRSANLSIFHFTGRKIVEVTINTKVTVNVTDFTRGLYLFQIRDKSGRIIETGKFQVDK